ncbi:LysR family transcriptional regulator [Rathayibacter rathayi]|uniref:LysR family transcriptional regulator n=1 Tax=Rathayibacter rathayi TaxID=33887 RepID=A0ABD6W7C6_RATRA|nr:LysR family transcriptional regulator [Rathayibacter rathayi]PPF13306.1 LysR family transcriptional regulator [Rathayibacter rathayi]PPF49138.1 LysR family transcriptional regulator [Rathayibacter rathayi]PPF79102.1 LysR family transcriptional regulator [Rathayibacter rathayi]PPG12528.1 LysR family transcriptional regulator [Rathayibacter rathayi]
MESGHCDEDQCCEHRTARSGSPCWRPGTVKLSQCAALISVVDEGTFTSAARIMGVTQSAISRSIAALESELGLVLLDRDCGRAMLTSSGRDVLERARLIVRYAQEIASIGSVDSTEPRLFRIGVSRSFSRRLLPRLVEEIRPRRDIRLDIRVGPCAQIEEWLRDSAVDVGIATLTGLGETADLLVSDAIHVVVPARHRLAARPFVTVRDLDGEQLLTVGGTSEDETLEFLRRQGGTSSVELRVDDLSTLLTLVARGRGITLLPGIALPTSATGLKALQLLPAKTHCQRVASSARGREHPEVERVLTSAFACVARMASQDQALAV